uniref:Protein kinase domain-containing protein n=1 Tax=Setaria digitata TaxID=48799 RepID=A0A915PL90_9BILA
MGSDSSDTWNNYYIQINKIGEGEYGTVYKAIDRRTGNLVAIKKVQINSTFESGIPSTSIREITLLKSLQHPNIVFLEDVIVDENQLHLVFEFVNMNLKACINNIPKGKLMDRAEQKSYLCQILQAVNFCHQRCVLHRDLKPENLLLNYRGGLKLANFSLGRTVNTPQTYSPEKSTTLFYKAPELLLGYTRYTKEADMWSIGCIAAEMATKRVLLPGCSDMDQIFRIFSMLSTPSEETWKEFADLPEYSEAFHNWNKDYLPKILLHFMDADGIKIVQQMIAYEPMKRISAKELLKNPYFASVPRAVFSVDD